MSTHTSPNSSNSWSLKSCLKVAAGLALLSNIAIVNACQSSTLEAKWDVKTKHVCKGRNCYDVDSLKVTYQLAIKDRYNGRIDFTVPNTSSIKNLGTKCSDDGGFCVTFKSPTDVELGFNGYVRKYNTIHYKEGNLKDYGKTHYWDCLD
ncbi:hypothetical protein BGW42_004075 [Actinomortierella wolfii]|nr:hypothetical protein BGW42_004075 [Actinomortierella wolfii]